MKKNYFYDCVRNTLSVNKNFLDEASIYNSTEYKLLKALREENPGMIVSVKKRKPPKKSTYDSFPCTQLFAALQGTGQEAGT